MPTCVYADSLSEFGLVDLGYRQFGYPLYLASTGAVADALTIEPLIFAVLVQRLLLVCGVAYAVYLWRWWSVPMVVLALTGEVIAYTNLVLTEGLSIPLALLLACSTAHVLRLLRGSAIDIPSRLIVALLTVVAVLSVALLSIRFPFAVFGICPLVVGVVAHRTPQRRFAWTAFGVFFLAAGGMVGMMSRENLTEYGDFSPSTRGGRSEYWATWTVVFRLDPQTREDPGLSDFFDGGDPYVLIGEIDSMDIPYSDQARLYDETIDELLLAAGMDPWGSRAASFLGALRGGRLDDIRGIIREILQSEPTEVDAVINSNALAQEQGAQAFAELHNDGQLPEAIHFPTLARRLPLPAMPLMAAVLLPLSLIGLIWGMTDPSARPLAVVGLTVTIAFALFIGFIRADNVRFLLTVTVFGVACASGVASLIFRKRPIPIATGTGSIVERPIAPEQRQLLGPGES